MDFSSAKRVSIHCGSPSRLGSVWRRLCADQSHSEESVPITRSSWKDDMRAALIAASVLLVVAITVLAVVRSARRGGGVARALLSITVAASIATGLAALPLLIDDGGGAVGIAVVVGPPLAITALAAPGERLQAAGPAIVWFSVLLMLAYLVIFGLGLGLLYLPTALLLIAAAIAVSARDGRGPSGQANQPVTSGPAGA